jgi:HSP20 family protein
MPGDYIAIERMIHMKLAKHHESEKGSLAPVSRTISPFGPMQRLQQNIDRLFGHPLSSWPLGGIFSDEPMTMDWLPAINVYEEKSNVVVKAEIPGMKKDEFEVYLTGGDNLNIAGERKAESEEKTADMYRSERYFGRFHRIIPLPVAVKSDAIEARYKDGVLTVTCPKTEEARRKQVEVKVD